MRTFTKPFTCTICQTEFSNPISLVKHVEIKHQNALKLSTINITRTEHKTYSGLLIESIIVSEFKDSNTLPIISENHVNKNSIDIGVIENYIEENLEKQSEIITLSFMKSKFMKNILRLKTLKITLKNIQIT